MTTAQAESRVIAAVLPDSAIRMETAQLRLITENNFSNPDFRMLWAYVDAYYDDHMAVIPRWVLEDTLRKSGSSEAKILSMLEMFDVFSGAVIPDHEFKSAMDLLKDDEATRKTDEAIVTAREILKGSYYDSKGENSLRGQEDARKYLSESLQELEVDGGDYAPEGDVRDDVEKILKSYLEKEANPEKAGGIKYGLEEVDVCTGGIRPGELVLIAGFTSSGKSQLVSSIAWNAMREGKNVLMFTTETTREEMEIRIIARHSRLPKFKCPGGLDSHDIQNGTLSDSHRKVFVEVLKDFKDSESGELFMVQMPTSGNTDYVFAKANQYNRKAPIDIIVVDSINLLRTGRRHDSKREMLDEMLPEFKRFASAFDNGRGVAVVSPWQMSRTAWKEAQEAGGVYTLASLADTSEAEKCFTLDTTVITTMGPRFIRDMSPGMEVIDMNGDIQTITDVNEYPNSEILEVTLNDGSVVHTSPGHLWRTVEGKRVTLMTSEEIMNGGEPVTIPYLRKDISYPASRVKYGLVFDPRMMGEILKHGETDMEGFWITPNPLTQEFLKNMPTPTNIVEVSGELSYYFTWESLCDHVGEFAFEDIIEANVMQSDRSKFVIPYTYYGGSDYVRRDFLAGLFDGYMPTTDNRMYTQDPRPEWRAELPLHHPGMADGMRRVMSSFGWTLEDGPRQIVSVKRTGRVEPTICLTVTGPTSTYMVDSHIITHNSASQIITIYKDDDGGSSRLNVQVIKNRGGEEMAKVAYPYDYRNSFIGESSDAPSSSGKSSATGPLNLNISDML